MKIYRPIRSSYKTQDFGENLACAKIDKNYKLIYPTWIIGTLTGICPGGFKSFYALIGMKGHNGIDMACWDGEPLYFPVDADCEWWVQNYMDADGGIGLDVYSDRPIYIEKLPSEAGKLARREWKANKGMVYVKFRFWHLNKSLLSDSKNNIKGKPEGYRECKVKFGQLIALCGNTGASSGPHLHWSMKIVANNSMTLDHDNGYYGAIPFTDYENTFCLDVLQVTEKALTVIELAKKVVFQVQQYIKNLNK